MNHIEYLRELGSKGGKARAQKLTEKQRRRIAKAASKARWEKKDAAQVVDSPSGV